MNTKQVIVIRKDLNMRKGKMCAQASHASMAFLTKRGKLVIDMEFGEYGADYTERYFKNESQDIRNNYNQIKHWIENSFRKIVCYVESEEELDKLYQKALDRGMIAHLIVDSGATEFGGVPTKTCLALGPHWDSVFEGVTDTLPLL